MTRAEKQMAKMVPPKNPSWVAPVLLIFLALLLRLPNLGYSFYGDEGFSLLRDSNYLLTPTDDRFRPVFFTLLFLWRTIGFDGEVGLRLLPLILGILSVPVAWSVGLRLGGRGFALGLGLLLATSPIHIEFSQELRMYSLVVFLSLAQLTCYLRYRESGGFWALLLGGLVGLVGMYTHLFYALYLMGFALLALLDRRAIRYKPFLASLLIVGLLYLPNLGNILYFAEVRRAGYAVHVASVLPKLAAALSVGFNLFDIPELARGRGIGWQIVWQNWHYVLPCALVFGLLVAGVVRRITVSGQQFALTSTIALLLLPILLAFALGAATQKNFVSAKYLIFLLPQILLLFAWGFQGLELRPLQLAVGVLYGLLIGLALLHFYADPVHYGRRANWRGVARYLEGRLSPEAPLVLVAGSSYGLLNYYGFETRPFWVYVDAPGDSAQAANYVRSLREKLVRAREVHYLREDEVQNAHDPRDIVLKALRTTGTDEECIQYNRRLKLYRWKLAESGPRKASTSLACSATSGSLTLIPSLVDRRSLAE